MNSPASLLPRAESRVLRVFGGRLEGACFALPPGRRLTLGHALDNDIVLRGARTRGCRIALQAQGGHLRVTLLAGEARLLGQSLEIGNPVLLPGFVPLALGEYNFAVGEESSLRWHEAEELAGQLVPVAGAAEEAQPAQRPDRADQARTRALALARYLPAWTQRPGILILAAAALVLALLLAPVSNYITRSLQGPEQVQAALVAEGFAGVRATRDPSGEFLTISGAVPDDASLARLRDLVAEQFPQARLDVDTNAALARAATDILATEGIDAEARPDRLGSLLIESEYLPADRRQELEARLKADLPALRRVRFELTGTRGPADLAYFFNSQTYGLATFVGGNPGYLVTADGSRWFEGAILPTGHEILAIRSGNVTLQRNGLIEQLVVDPGAVAPDALPPLAAERGAASQTLPTDSPPRPNPELRATTPPPSDTGDRT